MLLRNKKIFISTGVILIVAVPVSIVAWWATTNRVGPIDPVANSNKNDVTEVADRIKRWNAKTKILEKNTKISRFLPRHVDEKILNDNLDHIVEVVNYEKSKFLSLSKDNSIAQLNYNNENIFQKNYAHWNIDNQVHSSNKVVIPDHGKFRRETEINFSIANKNDQKGVINLSIEVAKGQNSRRFSKKVVIPVRGFHTEDERYENDVIFAKNAIFRKLNTDPNDDWTQTLPPQNNYDFELKINSELSISKKTPMKIKNEMPGNLLYSDLAKLEIYPPHGDDNEDRTNHQFHNAKVTYRIVDNKDAENGKLLIMASITKNRFYESLDIPISGFLTKDEENEAEVNDIWDKITSPQTTILTNQYANWTIGQKLDAQNLGIKDFSNEFDGTIVYEITEVQSLEGIVIVKAFIEKGNFKKEKLNILIEGFQKDKNEEIENVLSKIQNQKTIHHDLLPSWKEKSIVSPIDLGISALTEDEKNRMTIKYVIKSVNQDLGQVYVEVFVGNKITKKSKVITVYGFKIINQDIVDKISNYFKINYQDIKLASSSPLKNSLPSEAMNRFAYDLSNEELKKFNIKILPQNVTQGAILTYKIINSNDENGYVDVEVIIKKGEIIANAKFKVSGFQTEKIRNQNLVNEMYEKIVEENRLKETNNIINLLQTSYYTSRLPSRSKFNLEDSLDSAQLKGLNIEINQNEKVSVVSEVTKIDDQNGAIEVLITIARGESQKQIKVLVKGFKTKAEQDQMDIDQLKTHLLDLYKDVKLLDTSADKAKLPSEIQDELGNRNLSSNNLERLNIQQVNPEILNEATIEYKISSVNDGSGLIVVAVKIMQNDISDIFTFSLKGFQTQTERNKIEVVNILSKFDDDNKNISVSENKELNNKLVNDLGFKIGDIIPRSFLKKELKILWDEEDLDLDWEFRIKDLDEKDGSIVIEVTLIKHFASATTVLKVAGFKKAT